MYLVGCSKAPNALNSDYHARLQSQINLPNLIPYSDRHKLLEPSLEITQTSTIGILQLAKIQHCQLGQLIAERNSQLGKVAGPSAQFAYQVRFIQLLPKCIETLDDARLKDQLKTVYNEKREVLFSYWQQMTFQDPQLSSLNKPSAYSLMEINEQDKQAALNSLRFLGQTKALILNQQIDTIDISQLEKQLSAFYKNTYTTGVLRAMFEQIMLLQQQNTALKAVSIETLCKKGHSTEKANVLSNIFTKFYGSKIQQYHNLLLREYALIHPELSAIWQNENSKPYDSDLAIHPLDLANSLKTLSVEHVRWWQALYKSCGIVPGR